MGQEKPFSFRSDLDGTFLSKREIREYTELLGLEEKELDNPESVILDLGAGLEQNLAKEAKERSLRSKIISLDPRLGLTALEDTSLMSQNSYWDWLRRRQNRKNPEPQTLAALSQALPFKDGSIDHIYALYSVPFYHEENFEIIKKTFEETIRVLRPGGSIRMFPIIKTQFHLVKNILDEMKNENINYQLTPKIDGIDEGDSLLIITKNPEKQKTS